MRIENFQKLKRSDHSPKRDEFVDVLSDPPYFSLDSPFKVGRVFTCGVILKIENFDASEFCKPYAKCLGYKSLQSAAKKQKIKGETVFIFSGKALKRQCHRKCVSDRSRHIDSSKPILADGKWFPIFLILRCNSTIFKRLFHKSKTERKIEHQQGTQEGRKICKK
jgi:hypothetical protein